MSAALSAPRCDRTPAWAALKGHYEAHGREFDLREAFARDPGRFSSEGQALSVDERAELAELRRELTEVRMERDLLKRTVAFWVKESTL